MSNLLGTPMLKKFFEGHVPRAVKALETIAKHLAAPEPEMRLERPAPSPPDQPVDLWAWAAGYIGREPRAQDPVLLSIARQIQQRFIDEMKPPDGRHQLVLAYDVTGWTEDQIEHLAMECTAQCEENDEHPEARYISQKVLRPR